MAAARANAAGAETIDLPARDPDVTLPDPASPQLSEPAWPSWPTRSVLTW